MRILFDQGTPLPLRRELKGHAIDMVYERGWSTVNNGTLLALAEGAGYELLITTDQNLRYQQNLAGRRLAILVLRTTSWPMIRQHIARIQQAVDAMGEGAYLEIALDSSP